MIKVIDFVIADKNFYLTTLRHERRSVDTRNTITVLLSVLTNICSQILVFTDLN